MNTKTIAYIDAEWSEVLCERHGEAREEAIMDECRSNECDGSDCGLHVIHEFNSYELDCVEFCGAGHSFCGNCGSDMEHGEEINGDFAYCWNCHTTSVFLDGQGYVYVDSFERALDHLDLDLMGHTLGLLSDMLRMTKINAIVDDTRSRGLNALRLSVGYLPMYPEYGTVLVMHENDSSGLTAAQSHFDDLMDERDLEDEIKRATLEDLTVLGGLRTRDDFIFSPE